MAELLPKLSERLRNSGIELTEHFGSFMSLSGKVSVGDVGADCDKEEEGSRLAGGGISQSSTAEAAVAATAPLKLSVLEKENDDNTLL